MSNYSKPIRGVQSPDRALAEKPELLDNFVEHGAISIPNVLSPVGLEALLDVCHRSFRRPLPVTRTIRDPDWHLVDKVTLFRHPEGILQRLHSMRWLAPELLDQAAYSDNVVRTIGRYMIGTVHDEVGQRLLRHISNRAIINRMSGSQDRPAVLGIHQDPPQERGANTSFVLSDGVDLQTGALVSGGTLNVYACANVANLLGIDPPPHGFTATDTRYSVVFTNFTS